jgi:hypothetical protein
MAVRINLDIARDVFPLVIYKRLQVGHYREYFTHQIDYGFGYLLRYVRIKYPAYAPVKPDLVTALPVGRFDSEKIVLEFFDAASFKARQPAPFTAELISSPGADGCYAMTAPAAVDQYGFGVNFSATPTPLSTSYLNFLYKNGDTIRIDITGQSYNGSIFAPGFIDIALFGYYIPERSIEMNGGK